MSGFLKLQRIGFEHLKRHPNEFHLLTIIAIYARRTDQRTGLMLKKGEALIGDWASYGFSEQNYRTAKKNLEAWGFSTFKPTPRGTIATISDSTIYDINQADDNDLTNRQVTDSQRTPNGLLTTNKKDKKEKKEENGKEGSGEKKPGTEGQNGWQPTPVQIRIAGWFRRKESYRWSDDEVKSFRKLEPSEEDLNLLEFYYTYPHPADEDYRRRDLKTLLNNWSGELDRARRFEAKHKQPTLMMP